MENQNLLSSIGTIAQERLARRKFLSQAGLLGLGAAAATITFGGSKSAFADETEPAAETAQEVAQSKDTVAEIFTAALIAEDLATTFYYNGLVGAVIQDPNLAGPGGSATHVTSSGNVGNVDYIRAALTQEIHHAQLFRSLLGMTHGAQDPVQTFHFPARTFDNLANFTGILDALENAFIGAYLCAIQEFAAKSANLQGGDGAWLQSGDKKYSSEQLDYFAKVSASIMGIEAEHRVLGRVISNSNPANNLNYEGVDGLNAVYNGPKSAVAALTPFLKPSTGPGYSFATALAKQSTVSLPVMGSYPAM